MTNQVRAYEPLTSENAALVLIDHQLGLMTGVRDYSTGELKHNVVALSGIIKERATSSCFPRTLQHADCTTGRCCAENASAVYSNTTAVPHEFFDHTASMGSNPS
jgi:hypothetical protein